MVPYGVTEVTCVCFYLSRAHDLITRVHDMLSRSENTNYKHEYRLRTDDQISSLHCNNQINNNNTDVLLQHDVISLLHAI